MLNATEKNDMPRDKHWMALVQNDQLYFVHNLDPLRIMHCDLDAYCESVHNEVRSLDFTHFHFINQLPQPCSFDQQNLVPFLFISPSFLTFKLLLSFDLCR